eukprot:Sspe_Gene.108096::Locus_87258_Transcript_1_1_Confidence_1.000_Length_2018::g.108096::m.108096
MPVEANFGEVTIRKCIVYLCFDFETQAIWGTADIDLEWLSYTRRLVLEHHELEVLKVVQLSDERADAGQAPQGCSHKRRDSDGPLGCCGPPRGVGVLKTLRFEKDDSTLTVLFPRTPVARIRVQYKVRVISHCEESSLLWWRLSAPSGYDIIHTSGSQYNNKGIIPCMDHSTVSSDWDVRMCVPRGIAAWMASPFPADPPQVCPRCVRSSYRYTLVGASADMIGLGVGRLEVTPILSWPVPVRVWVSGAQGVPPEGVAKVAEAVAVYMAGMEELFPGLGVDKYDIVVVPHGWDLLGLSLPSGAFIAQGVVEQCMEPLSTAGYVIAHEMCHEWFGVKVSCEGMSEMWLNEAFATYCEVRVAQLGIGMKDPDSWVHLLLVGLIRERLLEHDLQQGIGGISGKVVQPDPHENTVRNKGFLILLYLMNHVGLTEFDCMIRVWCRMYSGKKVGTATFLHFFAQQSTSEIFCPTPPQVRSWLEGNDMGPLSVKRFIARGGGSSSCPQAIITKARTVLRDVQRAASRILGGRALGEISGPHARERWILILDAVREQSEPRAGTVHIVFGHAPHHDSDIMSRLLELAISAGVDEYYALLRGFLLSHQCMAPYLIGELLHSGRQPERELAEEIHSALLPILTP